MHLLRGDLAFSLLLSILLFATSLWIPGGSAEALPEADLPTFAASVPVPVPLEGSEGNAGSLVAYGASTDLLVWGMRPADAPSTHWTSFVLVGELYVDAIDPDLFLFYMWDGVSWAMCDNHPDYGWVGHPDGIAELRMVDGAQRLDEDVVGVSDPDASCLRAPTMDGTSLTYRVTADETEPTLGSSGGSLPVAWHGDIGLTTI